MPGAASSRMADTCGLRRMFGVAILVTACRLSEVCPHDSPTEHYKCMRSMVFSPNDSPLSGREGTHLTGSKIGERLAAEAATSVSLRVLPAGEGGEAFEVQARGELQLGLLIGAHIVQARV